MARNDWHHLSSREASCWRRRGRPLGTSQGLLGSLQKLTIKTKTMRQKKTLNCFANSHSIIVTRLLVSLTKYHDDQFAVRLWLGKGLHKGRKVALTIPELVLGLLPVKHDTAQCRFRTVVIRTAVALFSHRCRIALLAFALLTFALLSLRTVDPFALLAFALLASHWGRSHFCLSHSCRTSRRGAQADLHLRRKWLDRTGSRRW